MEQYYNEEMGAIISEGMSQKGMTIGDLAEKLDIAYESCRRYVKGAPAAKPILRTMCKVLDLDFNALLKMTAETQIRRKHGEAYLQVVGKNPELEKIEQAWKYLTPEQKKDATNMIQSWAKRAKALGAVNHGV